MSQIQDSTEPSGLTAAEVEALARGGLNLAPRSREEHSALARTAAKYASLLETSLTAKAAAERLGLDASRIRQRLVEGTLYGLRTPEGWRLPAFQFLDDRPLPGLGETLVALGDDLHPVAVHNFFVTPHVDLHAKELGRDLSPREWLEAGYPIGRVVDLAVGLE